MSDFLHEMAALSAERARVANIRASQLEERLLSATPPTGLDVPMPGFGVISEVKLAGPSGGRLLAGGVGTGAVVDLARRYEEGGSVAISVLTEESTFGGDLAQLQSTADAVGIPVMRKDFLVDPVQVIEARATGASGVLLIARILSGHLLEEMTDLALEHDMFVIVEVFDRSDLDFAARVFDRDVLVGVNCRDLTSLQVDASRFEVLAPHLPGGLLAVAESGIVTADDAASVASLGYRLALVGTSLVSAPDPGARVRELIAAGQNVWSGAEA